jgi:hypothetical protein
VGLTEYFADAVRRDISQGEMADELGVERRTVVNWMGKLGWVWEGRFVQKSRAAVLR